MQIKVAVEDAMVGIRVMVEIEKIEKIEIVQSGTREVKIQSERRQHMEGI